jgi:FkbM family methyltransferase
VSLKRLLKSIAWKLLPCAGLEARTPAGLRLPVRDKGEWGCLDEIFVGRAYEPFCPHLQGVRGWVDLGCNVGFFSLGLLDALARHASGTPPATTAFLGDANETCVGLASETIRRNGLAPAWRCEHVVIGPPGETVSFAQFKFSIHSNIFARQRGERTFRYRTTDFPALMGRLCGVFDLIKIDVEGAEMFLFKHHGDWLRKFGYGLCEWHAPQFEGAALRVAVRALGFEVLEMRSQPAEGYDVSRGHSWESPVGMALWRNPSLAV